MKAQSQTTIKERVSLTGVGVHSGEPSTVTFHPAEPDTGILFLKNSAEGPADIEVPASHRFVVPTALRTVPGSDDAGPIATLDHLMATLCCQGP